VSDYNSIYFPHENTGVKLKSRPIREVEQELADLSSFDFEGAINASRSELPEESPVSDTPVYIKKYRVPTVEGENHLEAEIEFSEVYSVMDAQGHYFIAEDDDAARYIPDSVSSGFYKF